MEIVRLYTGDDGESHLEALDVTSHPELATLHQASGVVFRRQEPGYFSDWHNAPRRQYIFIISGEVEYVLGDGSVHRFGPGHVTLAEDLTGRGHITRVVGDQPRVVALVHLPDA